MYMILLVLDNPDLLDEVMESWNKAGIANATIIESTGIHRTRAKSIHMRFLYQATGSIEEGHLTLLVIVENEQQVQACLEATEKITGDLSGPNTGIFTAWPLQTVKGLPKKSVKGS